MLYLLPRLYGSKPLRPTVKPRGKGFMHGFRPQMRVTYSQVQNVTYCLQDGSQVFTFIYLRHEDNEKTCKFFSVLTMLEIIEIADSSSSAKDESMLEVAGAVGVDAT